MQTKKVLISMPEGLLNYLDKLAKEEQRSRSEMIRETIRSYDIYKKVVNNKVFNS